MGSVAPQKVGSSNPGLDITDRVSQLENEADHFTTYLTVSQEDNLQAPVVQTLDSAIHQINHYPADKYYGNQLRYLLDSDLSGG